MCDFYNLFPFTISILNSHDEDALSLLTHYIENKFQDDDEEDEEKDEDDDDEEDEDDEEEDDDDEAMSSFLKRTKVKGKTHLSPSQQNCTKQ